MCPTNEKNISFHSDLGQRVQNAKLYVKKPFRHYNNPWYSLAMFFSGRRSVATDPDPL
jgi:hypothetical protein